MKPHARRTHLIGVAVVALTLAGCTVRSDARTDSAAGTDSTIADTTAAGAAKPGALGVNVDAGSTPPSSPDSSHASTANVVTFTGASPLRIGMSAAEARKALGMPASNAAPSECTYLDTKGRSHAFVMLVRDTVARLDIRDSTLATEAGVRVGDAEARVMERYRGRVTTEPHKYVQGGHYLIVSSPSDKSRKLVFETDGKQVTSYHVGRMPEVRFVEGCG